MNTKHFPPYNDPGTIYIGDLELMTIQEIQDVYDRYQSKMYSKECIEYCEKRIKQNEEENPNS